MKTNMTKKTMTFKLYADGTSSKKVGTVTTPVYEEKPEAIVHDGVIYIQNKSWPYESYHAVELVHVMTDGEFAWAKEETKPAPKLEPVETLNAESNDIPL